MWRKIVFGLIWLGLIVYTFAFTLPDQAVFLNLIINLYTGKWNNINALIISLFWILTLLPIVYACFLLFDGKDQRIPPLPFVLASLGLGAYALLPYFALRESNTNWDGNKNWLLKILDSRLVIILLAVTITLFFIWGIINGDWNDFVLQLKPHQFIDLMVIDFVILCLLFPAILKDDMIRRGVKNDFVFWLATLIPLFGTLIYLCIRPALPNNIMEQNT